MALRVGILTSNETRHRYFVNAVAARFNVVAVGYQETGYRPADSVKNHPNSQAAEIVDFHFKERERQEGVFFGHTADAVAAGPRCAVRRLDASSLNGASTIAFLAQADVDVVLIYGTGMIKPPLLDRCDARMINMHLGLSPYYRGTATNFYPLVNQEPEYVGATIHMIDAGIDSGAIIHHARPEITADDMPHTVGCKAILAGIEKVIQSLEEVESARLVTVPQWPVENARLYLRKDYHPSQVVRLYELIEAGLFPNYVARKDRARNAFRLIP